jgi:ABC-2 type transport system permease protein
MLSVAFYESMTGIVDYAYPPVITLSSVNLSEETEKKEDDDDSDTGPGFFVIFLFVFPGVSVYALFLVGDLAMRDILTEGDAGTLRRQIQGPVTTGAVLRAKAVFSATVALISLILLSIGAWIAASDPINIPAFLSLSMALILAVVGSAAVIYGAAGSAKRGAVISSIVYIILAFSGGSFVDISAMPGAVRAIAPFSPFYWGTLGFKNLIGQNASIQDLLPTIGILAGMGIVFLLLGGVLLNRNLLRRGGQ